MRRFCAIVPHVSFVIRALVCYAKRSFPRHSERLFLVTPSAFSSSLRAPFPRHSERLFLVTPSAFSCHSEHLFLSFRAPFPVIPSESEESSAWMLHCAQHDKPCGHSEHFFCVIPSESEESMTLFVLAKADASLRLRSVQHNKSRSVTPNAARNP
jgi:hypothetical protein